MMIMIFVIVPVVAVIMPNIRNAIIWRVLSNTQQTKEFDYRNSNE